ncbi:MAG: InlB B-repeat-containing protein [bacterium]
MKRIFMLLLITLFAVAITTTGCGDDGGDNGDTGNTGNTGNTGDTGDTGNTGNTGDSGNTGEEETCNLTEDFLDAGDYDMYFTMKMVGEIFDVGVYDGSQESFYTEWSLKTPEYTITSATTQLNPNGTYISQDEMIFAIVTNDQPLYVPEEITSQAQIDALVGETIALGSVQTQIGMQKAFLDGLKNNPGELEGEITDDGAHHAPFAAQTSVIDTVFQGTLTAEGMIEDVKVRRNCYAGVNAFSDGANMEELLITDMEGGMEGCLWENDNFGVGEDLEMQFVSKLTNDEEIMQAMGLEAACTCYDGNGENPDDPTANVIDCDDFKVPECFKDDDCDGTATCNIDPESLDYAQCIGGDEDLFTVTYDANDENATGDVPVDDNEYAEGDEVTVLGQSDLALEGYTFEGWNTADDGSGDTHNEGDTFDMGTENVTLYAVWTAIPTYSVIYDGNGNDIGTGPDDPADYVEGDDATVLGVSDLEKFGYGFDAWNTADDGSGDIYEEGDDLPIGTEDVTLFAQWIAATNTYNVNYHGNGNDDGGAAEFSDPNDYAEGNTVTVLDQGTFTKTDCTFDGWNTADDGSGTDRAVDATFTMATNHVDLYAVWDCPLK